jgi:GTPase SAR1 family protein
MTKVDLKIVLLGQQHVGKSCLVDRCVLTNIPKPL